MQFIKTIAAAALIGAATAKDDRTFAVLRFTNKHLVQGRMDPIVSPGKTSTHVHTVMGGSGFSLSSTGEDLEKSQCTNAMIVGDNSNYWFPSVYFHDENADTFEPVEVFYVNAYYFFEATDDEIKAFPKGLAMISGDAMTRTAPADGNGNQDPDAGPINGVKWTCPRDGNNYSPPSWPEGSDGSMGGIGDTNNKGEGVGFPFAECDGYASPLRADIHFPSCYNPDAGLMNSKENMAWPKNVNGKNNCPEGWIHVPHLFLEVYWNTPEFIDRWTPNSGKQPFVLSNGDVTGFSSHADFMAGWDEATLQNIIDTCDAGSAGMDKCPGVQINSEDCTIPSAVDEEIGGTLSALPGNNPLSGWQYGSAPPPQMPEDGDDDEEETEPETPTPTSGLPEEEDEQPTNIVENPGIPDPSEEAPAPAPEPTTAPAPEPVPEPQPAPEPSSSCADSNVVVVWETVTVTESAPKPTIASAKFKREHLHGHLRHHKH